MSMIERVARAICKSRTCEGINCCQWPANMGRTKCPVRDGGYDDAARDAIAAMREATNEMIFEGNGLVEDDQSGEVWQAMIDEALK